MRPCTWSLALSLILISIVGAASLAPAEAGVLSDKPCLRGQEPAATLLFPYFEVDLADPSGKSTLVAITNAVPEPVLAHVVAWSNWGAPVLAFDLYLTGFDVQTLNLRDVLDGHLPQTGSATSPVGEASEPNAAFPGCDVEDVRPAPIDPEFLHRALTGRETRGGCWGARPFTTFDFSTGRRLLAPEVAVGYLSVDVARRCSELVPGDDGYFAADESGVASFTNALLGDWFIVEPGEDFAQGGAAVHLVADPDFFGPSDATFYGVYVGQSGVDARRPLADRWSVRYIKGGGFDGGTDFVVWRQPNAPSAAPYLCDDGPELNFRNFLRIFDEEENLVTIPGPGSNSSELFPFVTHRADAAVIFPFDSGWTEVSFTGGFQNSTTYDQGWVGALYSAEGRYSTGVAGTPLDDPCVEEDD